MYFETRRRKKKPVRQKNKSQIIEPTVVPKSITTLVEGLTNLLLEHERVIEGVASIRGQAAENPLNAAYWILLDILSRDSTDPGASFVKIHEAFFHLRQTKFPPSQQD